MRFDSNYYRRYPDSFNLTFNKMKKPQEKEYNGFIIKIVADYRYGYYYTILKVVAGKWISIRQVAWEFETEEGLFQKAKNYIDGFPAVIFEKIERKKKLFAEKVVAHKDYPNYPNKDIDVSYYTEVYNQMLRENTKETYSRTEKDGYITEKFGFSIDIPINK